VVPYEIAENDGGLSTEAVLPMAQLRFERTLKLDGRSVRIRENVLNLSACDRPIAWTQHVTLGPPFVQAGVTEFRASAGRSKVYERDFGSADYLKIAAEFQWPSAPLKDGGTTDLRVMRDVPAAGAFTTHLMEADPEIAFFTAFAPASKLAFGYVWKYADFPWMGIWEENRSRNNPPWNGETVARGMEFGVSPVPESRREMIDRGSLFGVPAYRWLPAKSALHAEYWAVARTADAPLEALEWPA
jgi:hypothetical protein